MSEIAKNSEPQLEPYTQAELPINYLWSNPQYQQYFVDAASVASLLGVILSVLALWQVWGLKKKFLNRQRLPELATLLEQELSAFNNALESWQEVESQKTSCDHEAKKCRSELEASLRRLLSLLKDIIEKGCSASARKEIGLFLVKYDMSNKKTAAFFQKLGVKKIVVVTLELAWEIHPQLPALSQKVKHVVNDMNSEVS